MIVTDLKLSLSIYSFKLQQELTCSLIQALVEVPRFPSTLHYANSLYTNCAASLLQIYIDIFFSDIYANTLLHLSPTILTPNTTLLYIIQ